MAKASTVVKLADIHHFDDWNVSRVKGSPYRNAADRDSVVRALLPGWQLTQTLRGVHASEEDKKRAVSEREAKIKELENLQQAGGEAGDVKIALSDGTVTLSPADLLATYRRMYCDEKGKVLAPKFIGICGFRRCGVMFLVNAVATKRQVTSIKEIPAVIEDFTTPAERMQACIMENTTQGIGRRPLNYADLLSAAKALFGLGCRESEIQKSVCAGKRGAAQKMFKVLELDAKFPKLAIVDGFIADEKGAQRYGQLRFTSKDGSDVTLSTLDKLDKSEASEAAVKAYLADPKGGTGNEPKMMSKPDIQAIMAQTPVAIIKAVANAILSNDKSKLAPFAAKADAINKAVEAALK